MEGGISGNAQNWPLERGVIFFPTFYRKMDKFGVSTNFLRILNENRLDLYEKSESGVRRAGGFFLKSMG